jgi:hypothetical protein
MPGIDVSPFLSKREEREKKDFLIILSRYRCWIILQSSLNKFQIPSSVFSSSIVCDLANLVHTLINNE